jgi:AraC-like DNA-binding protein
MTADQKAFDSFLHECQPIIHSTNTPVDDLLRACCELAHKIPPLEAPDLHWQLSGVLVHVVCDVAVRLGTSGGDGCLTALIDARTHTDLRDAFLRILYSLGEARSQDPCADAGCREEPAWGEAPKPKVMSALSFIRENSRNPALRLADVARHAGLSRCHLDRLLVRSTGAGFIGHLRDARLARARTLLLDTEMSIKEIAFAVGYKYANELNRHFRIVYGSTPRLWRRDARCLQNATVVHN